MTESGSMAYLEWIEHPHVPRVESERVGFYCNVQGHI